MRGEYGMILFVTGGSGSGKSEYAEARCAELNTGRMLYVATMEPSGREGKLRVKRHRRLRAGKGFETLECYTHLEAADIPDHAVVLLECLSNLTANEMYSANGRKDDVVGFVMKGVSHLAKKAEHLVIVTNNVFGDGISYDDSTVKYQRYLAQVNAQAAAIADEVTEVVAGIPIRLR
ncbi:MAG: bifunctional adenosylcobinamide kinase/adenosylcobinamide-phosphate guanylyltransferase [Clostridiales bacterium]|nr:bifunctional adenosylcobinamide kinase/adenosylcobinamide-phosphate guanylyltransferase [Clostridiales bacterium]